MKLQKALFATLASVALSACATGSVDIQFSDDAGRMGISDARLGDRRADVIENATAKFGSAPDCRTTKILVKNSRRAYAHETCSFDKATVLLNDIDIDLMSYHFIDDLLLRVDVAAYGDAGKMHAVKEELDLRFGRVATASASSTNNYRWQTAEDRALLWRDKAEPDMFNIQLVDIDAAIRAFSL